MAEVGDLIAQHRASSSPSIDSRVFAGENSSSASLVTRSACASVDRPSWHICYQVTTGQLPKATITIGNFSRLWKLPGNCPVTSGNDLSVWENVDIWQ